MSKQETKEQKLQKLRNDYKEVFESKAGERVLKDIMEYCHVLEPLVGSIDTNNIIIREARRDVALTILQKLKWKEEQFINTVESDNV